MAVRYQARLFDQTGTQVAVFDDTGGFRSFSFTRRLNGKGLYVLEINGKDVRVPLFVLDAQVQFRRFVEDRGETLLDWYTEFEVLHRTPVIQAPDRDKVSFRSHGFGLNYFLSGREIRYKAGTNGAQKSGAAETVMKSYVDENIGPSATTGNGRLRNGVMTGFSVETDGAAGPTWKGSRAYKNLLDVLQEIAVNTGIDFRVVGNGAGQFQFQTFQGVDRSTVGLDRSTGKNGAGNVPIIFSYNRGMMSDVVYSLNRSDESNSILALGQGQKTIRETELIEDDDAIADSPWNLRESSINAQQEGEVEALESSGETVLAEKGAKESFSFEVVPTGRVIYGLHYFMGDVVTARFEPAGIEAHLKLVGVTVTFEDGVEKIDHEFAELP
jgi:hypothetical protein